MKAKEKEYLGKRFEDEENNCHGLNTSDYSESDFSSTIDDNSSADIETEADILLTSNQKQASYYEQEQY